MSNWRDDLITVKLKADYRLDNIKGYDAEHLAMMIMQGFAVCKARTSSNRFVYVPAGTEVQIDFNDDSHTVTAYLGEHMFNMKRSVAEDLIKKGVQ